MNLFLWGKTILFGRPDVNQQRSFSQFASQMNGVLLEGADAGDTMCPGHSHHLTDLPPGLMRIHQLSLVYFGQTFHIVITV
jgi:hypothetical protein